MTRPLDKLCTVCARPIQWRKKWERCWEEVKYCSNACRRAGGSSRARLLEAAIVKLIDGLKPGATICPSQAARLVDPLKWADLMNDTRSAARRLAGSGRVVFLQRGRPVDPATAKGPVRLGPGPKT